MKRTYSPSKLILLILFLLFSLIGCSGGGGSSSDGAGGDSGLPPISYVGLTTPASITEGNAEDMIFGSLLGVETGGSFALSAESQNKQTRGNRPRTVSNNPNVIDLPLVLKNTSKNISFNIPKRYPLGAAVSAVRTSTEIINGNCGGTATYTININDVTGAYNGTFIFSQYCEDGIVISRGDTRINGTVNLATGEIITITYAFENLTVDDFIFKGNVFVNDAVTPQIITLDLLAKDSASNKVYWAKDYSLVITEINETDFEIAVSGTYYDPDQGYITVSTPSPILFSTLDWPISGILLCIGDKNTKAKLTAINDYSYTIESDTNGDNSYNYNSGVLFWPGASSWVRLLGSEKDGSSGSEFGGNIAVDSIGNSYIAGHTTGNLDGNINAAGNAAFVSKYDTNGNKQWTKLIGTTVNGISVDEEGNIYIIGYNDEEGTYLIAKYDTNVSKLWAVVLGKSSDYFQVNGMAVDLSGNCYITGSTAGDLDGNIYAGGMLDVFVSKFDNSGNKLWTKLLGSSMEERGNKIAVDTLGNCYITGSTNGNLDGNIVAVGPDYPSDVFVSKYDTNGNKQWTKLFGTIDFEVGTGVAVDLSGSIYITGTKGHHTSTLTWLMDVFVIKLDANGNEQWTKMIETPANEYSTGIAVDLSGNSYITGYTDGNLDGNINSGESDILVAKYDTNGNKLWAKLLGTSHYDGGYGIALDPNRNIYMTGMTDGNLGGSINSGGDEIFIWKLVQP